MKTLTFTTVITLSVSPAFAHGGTHLHPHGGEAVLALGVLAACGAIVFGVARR